ncbi:MAG: hypothetical protein COV59_05300 [Candidatus Magasanikbacteria bacterium CG11_big_fil_rev_8_21_14_0_20_39_34]|uniref:Thioredoxin domain-containing protein n=1 Tax=Candidatus Magasanikbacteria bacterium CG11_big_fil_rev_8_21_14_0_20_39_34 TaxID=1974653 RepID=A0A2H0N3U9_9BACT|nr:MAG: hypothetical protein COV59_05300 [Candidatus Magasanikbacteria bacterium CG11_big_fil_rev_8_21_14_0_20_39_34]
MDIFIPPVQGTKRFFMKKIAYTLLISGFLFFAGAVHAQENCPDLQSYDVFSPHGSNAVYMLNKNSEMVPFPNDDVYKSWFDDYSIVQDVDPTCITYKSPQRAPFFVDYRSGSRILKRPLSPKLYVIKQGNVLAPVNDGKILENWYGKDWSKLIRDVSDELLTSYERSSDVIEDGKPFDGMYIEKDGVEYILSQEKLQKIDRKLPLGMKNALVHMEGDVVSLPPISMDDPASILPLREKMIDLIPYSNEELGFHLEYPSNFDLVEGSILGDNIISFVSPQESQGDLFYESFSVLVDDATGTLEEYSDDVVSRLTDYFTDFQLVDSKLLEQKDGVLYPTKKLVYSTTQFGKEIRTIQFITLKDNKGYLLTFVMPAEIFPKFSETVNYVRNSFRIVEGSTIKEDEEVPSQVFEGIQYRPMSNTQDNIIGNPDAKITILEYTDLECPFCASFYETTNKLLDTYKGKVRLVVRHFPLFELHEHALPLANGAQCAAQQGKFKEYLDAVFADQLEAVTAGNIFLAQKIGLNMVQFNLCLQDKRTEEDVLLDRDDALKAGADGTPYSLLIGPNGEVQIILGAQRYESVSALIDKML